VQPPRCTHAPCHVPTVSVELLKTLMLFLCTRHCDLFQQSPVIEHLGCPHSWALRVVLCVFGPCARISFSAPSLCLQYGQCLLCSLFPQTLRAGLVLYPSLLQGLWLLLTPGYPGAKGAVMHVCHSSCCLCLSWSLVGATVGTELMTAREAPPLPWSRFLLCAEL
jgi:hypothetical protein